MRAGRVGGADALLELLDGEPPGGAVLAQLVHGGLALRIGGAHPVVGTLRVGGTLAARRWWWREWHMRRS